MLKILSVLLLLISSVYAKITVVSSIAPVEGIVKKIGGEYIESSVMVPQGASPHTYEPKSSQMRDISRAKLYFAVGVEFEDIWLKKFEDLNHNMKIVKLDKGIKKYPMESKHHHHRKHPDEEDGFDPHIWTSIDNLRMIATKIAESLESADGRHSKYYQARLKEYIDYLNNLKQKITTLLKKDSNHKVFMVFHPSWGYFAREFNLKMIAMETEGKEPGPKELISLVEEAKKNHISAVITQPEFSDKKAKLLAKEIGVPVEALSPLSENIGETLLRLAELISGENIEK